MIQNLDKMASMAEEMKIGINAEVLKQEQVRPFRPIQFSVSAQQSTQIVGSLLCQIVAPCSGLPNGAEIVRRRSECEARQVRGRQAWLRFRFRAFVKVDAGKDGKLQEDEVVEAFFHVTAF